MYYDDLDLRDGVRYFLGFAFLIVHREALLCEDHKGWA
jgi:hypothetical protein